MESIRSFAKPLTRPLQHRLIACHPQQATPWPRRRARKPAQAVLRSAGFRVVAYDCRGFGRSDKPAAGYDDDTLADDLLHMLETALCRTAAW